MKKTLFLLTSEYPYGHGEAFLEAEIIYLSNAFDNVYILSHYLGDNGDIRSIPNNAEVVKLTDSLSLKKKMAALFTGIIDPYFWNAVMQFRKLPIQISFFSITNINIQLLSLYRAKVLKRKLARYITNLPHSEQIYTYSYWCNDMAVGLALLKREYPNIKAYSRAHRWELYFEYAVFGKPGLLPFRDLIFNSLDKIFCISLHGQQYLNGFFPKYQHKFALSRLGTKPPIKRNSVDNEKIFHLLSVSSVYAVKRVPLIAEALRHIHPSIKLCWTHIGTGPDIDLVKKTANEIKNTNIEVRILGAIQNAEVLKHYEECPVHALINTSTSEGLPVSMMEAMSFGVPVIGTAVGGVPEIITHQKTGFLLKENPSPQEIADAILYFYEMKHEVYEAYRDNARATWESQFDASKNYPEFTKMISR